MPGEKLYNTEKLVQETRYVLHHLGSQTQHNLETRRSSIASVETGRKVAPVRQELKLSLYTNGS